MIFECSSDLVFNKNDSSGEKPRSSNTFRGLCTFLLLRYFGFRVGQIFPVLYGLEPIMRQVKIAFWNFISRLSKAMQHINPSCVQSIQQPVPEILILISQLANPLA